MTEGNQSVLQIVLIDFGKATMADDGRKYNLSDVEKAEYTRRYPQMAPEVVDGVTRQTKWSDIYAAGGVIQRIMENQCFNQLPVEYKSALNSIVIKCRCPQYHTRLTAQRALQSFKEMLG